MPISRIPSLSGFENVVDNFLNAHASHGEGSDIENRECRLVQPTTSVETKPNPNALMKDINAVLGDKWVLDSQRGTTVLEHAEAVIEHQRDRINTLEEALGKFNESIKHTNDLYKQDVAKLESDNKELRLQIQNLIAEYETISRRYQSDKSEFETVKQQLANADADLLKYRNECTALTQQCSVLPQENAQLREDKMHLINEVERLKKELSGISFLKKSAPQEKHNVCDIRNMETRAMGKCLAQVENDLTTHKRLVESQRLEIKRLHDIINAQKSKQQPLSSEYLYCAHQQMLQMRKVLMNVIQQVNTQQAPTPKQVDVETAIDNRSIYAAMQLKATAEQRNMYDQLLQVVYKALNQSKMQSSRVLYTVEVNYVAPGDLSDSKVWLQAHSDQVVLTDKDGLVLEQFKSGEKLSITASKDDLEHIIRRDGRVYQLRASDPEGFRKIACALGYAAIITAPPTASGQLQNANYKSEQDPKSLRVIAAFGNCDVSRETLLGDPQEFILHARLESNELLLSVPNSTDEPVKLTCESCFLKRIDQKDDHGKVIFESGAQVGQFLTNNPACISWKQEQEYKVVYMHVLNPWDEIKLVDLLDEMRFNIDDPELTKAPRAASTCDLSTSSKVQDQPENKTVELPSQLYKFVGDDLYLYMQSDAEPVIIDNLKGSFRVQKDRCEVAIISKRDENNTETYVLSFPQVEAADVFVAELLEHHFERDDLFGSEYDQVCIVTMGKMVLYKSVSEDPIFEFTADNTRVTVDEIKREICVIQEKEKLVKMTLDCTNPYEFGRWKFALEFGGFIKTPFSCANSHSALKKYIFPIKIFGDTIQERRAFVVGKNEISLYVNPTIENPLLIFFKVDIDLEVFEAERRIRVYIQHNTKLEERFDFILPMLSDFNLFKEDAKRQKYNIGISKRKRNLPKCNFILAKPGLIAIHKSKFDVEPFLVIRSESYDCKLRVDGFTIKFVPKQPNSKKHTLTFKREIAFKKWLLALKVAGFIPITKAEVPILYFPTIIYGHLCQESLDALK
ncbi:hypothetical protein BdWA1_002611 [Babesia duncani]|uniref:Uncharacterized protein n=1 Tax=Babesia duncani TaxID=323732 RepID=A0AAD9UNH0_9APIC|nr:hypothetical protein BdWA1_002611 [Babesia duncani]